MGTIPLPSALPLPPALRDSRRAGRPLPPPRRSGRLLLRLAPEHVALFQLVFSPQRERAARRALAEISRSLPFSLEEWPLPGFPDASETASQS